MQIVIIREDFAELVSCHVYCIFPLSKPKEYFFLQQEAEQYGNVEEVQLLQQQIDDLETRAAELVHS